MGKKNRSGRSAVKRSKKGGQKKAANQKMLAASASSVESVPISPSVKSKVRAILRERGFTAYQNPRPGES